MPPWTSVCPAVKLQCPLSHYLRLLDPCLSQTNHLRFTKMIIIYQRTKRKSIRNDLTCLSTSGDPPKPFHCKTLSSFPLILNLECGHSSTSLQKNKNDRCFKGGFKLGKCWAFLYSNHEVLSGGPCVTIARPGLCDCPTYINRHMLLNKVNLLAN